MAAAITVPRRGWSMDEGTFAGWLKRDGERVRRGDPLFVLETDKAAEEIEALDAGALRLPPDAPRPGDTVKVGQVLAYLVAEGEAAPATCGGRPVEAMSPGRQDPATPETAQAAPAVRRRQAISPRARRAAAELGVEWGGLRGSGRSGRIRERDVRAAAAARTEGRLIPHTNTRRTIAARMVAGATQAAPVTLTVRANAGHLVKARNYFNGGAPPGEVVPGYTDLLLKLAAAALRQHPLLQAQWRDDGLFVPDRIDIAVAVDTEGGLLAPVVRGVDRLTVRQIAAQSHDLIGRARAGRLRAEEMRGATFTVSNLGGLGIDAFTPIIHLPQCAVLGLGRIAREPVVVEGHVVPGHVTTLSLAFDHRVVDGAPAARFLDALRRRLERPFEEDEVTG
jgi:pyruvate dehydrogenase E2 component (dihydrolipoamide acetyltransferase)